MIVNSIGGKFSLCNGMVSNALRVKCGKNLQEELNQQNHEYMRLTSGLHLPCRKILHVVLPRNADEIKHRLRQIFLKCDEEACQSLAMPILGTGNLKLKSSFVASILRECLTELGNDQLSLKFLKKVSVVVFDPSMLHEFAQELLPEAFAKSTMNDFPQNDVVYGSSHASNGDQLTKVVCPLSINVRYGDITESNVDVVVNFCIGGSFSFSFDDEVQSELSKLSNSRIRVTSAGTLHCKKIIHANVLRENELSEITKDAFSLCDKEGYSSIALPASQAVSGALFAKNIERAVSGFSNDSSNSGNLKKVMVIVHEQSMVVKFSKHFHQESNSGTSSDSLVYSRLAHSPMLQSRIIPSLGNVRKIRDVNLFLVKGDITESKTDAIVNSCGDDFNLSRGQVSRAILRKAGTDMQREVSKCKGSIRITDAGNLPSKKVFHVIFPNKRSLVRQWLWSWLPFATERYLMKDQIICMLQEVDKNGCHSLSLPAIGTGNLALPTAYIAGALAEAVSDWRDSITSLTKLKEIRLVVREKDKYEDFQKEIFSSPSEVEESASSSNRIRFCYYATDGEVLNQAVKKVTHRVENLYYKKTIGIPQMDKFLRWKKDELTKMSSVLKFTIRWTWEGGEFELEGVREVVEKACTAISSHIQDVNNAIEIYELADYLWWYKSTDQNSWIEFDELSSNNLEKTFKAKYGMVCVFIGKMMICNFDTTKMELVNEAKCIAIARDTRGDLPSIWSKMPFNETYKLFQLSEYDDEYTGTLGKLQETVKSKFIQSICRVQNKALYRRYQMEKERVSKVCQKSTVERTLFHGTDATTANKIASGSQGFDRARAGDANAARLGKGTYFAESASYFNGSRFAKPDTNGIKTIIIASVITGDYCKGSENLRALPVMPNSKKQYDCAVDDVNNPTMFVIFSDVAAYPSYIIKYKK